MKVTFKKGLLIISAFILSTSLLAQKKSAFYKDINFDSSYILIGVGDSGSWEYTNENLQRFSFILDNPDDLAVLKKDWMVKTIVPRISIEKNVIDIFTIKNKVLTRSGPEMIYPNQGIIKTLDNWYKFDTMKILKLHNEHPLKYKTLVRKFDTHLQYAFFYDSVTSLPSLLFLTEPNVQYEGKFIVTIEKSSDPSSAIFALSDLNKELNFLFPKKKYKTYTVINDSFNIYSKNKVKVTVESSKDLYDAYDNKRKIKEEWQPSIYETRVFLRN